MVYTIIIINFIHNFVQKITPYNFRKHTKKSIFQNIRLRFLLCIFFPVSTFFAFIIKLFNANIPSYGEILYCFLHFLVARKSTYKGKNSNKIFFFFGKKENIQDFFRSSGFFYFLFNKLFL